MKKPIALLVFLVLFISAAAPAQTLPKSVHVDVPNHLQETEMWCWAAAAQQIIEWSEKSTMPQCGLVAVANNIHPAVCCAAQSPTCVRTGTMTQVQSLIKMYTGRSSRVINPTVMSLYAQLTQGKPVIIQVRMSPLTTHVVVLTGMTFVWTRSGAMAILELNDPMSIYTIPVPYSNLSQIIVNALVVD